MYKKPFRFSSLAVFLAVILTTMLLSRMEERRQIIPAAGESAVAEQAVPVLMYHHLLHRGENTRYTGNNIVTYVEDFEQQLRWLKSEGFESISPDQLLAWYVTGAPLPEKPVMLTFDDGYLSNAVYAYPLLKELGYTGVIFSVTAKISEKPASFRADQINMLDSRTMRDIGDVFYFASHTHDLHSLKGKHSALVSADAAAVREDLQKSLDTLRQFPSGTDTLFSYPYGNYSDTVETVLQEQGVQLAFRAYKGRLTRKSAPYELPRYPVSYEISFKTFKKYFSDYIK